MSRSRVSLVVGIALATFMAIGTGPVAAHSTGAAAAPTGVTPSGLGLPAGLTLSPQLSGYLRPVFVTGDGGPKRLFVVEQYGKIRVATRPTIADPWVKAGVFLNLTGIVHDPDVDGNERGLLGLAFAPDYATSRLFYVYYTRKSDDKDVLEEFHARTSLKADPDSGRVVFATADPASNHNGGWIAFGPDHYLYVAAGDGGGSPDGRPQSLASRHGKILRLDPRDAPGSARYTVPSDNPYFGVSGDEPLIWARGLRNPWRDSFDSATGDLWIGDVGEGTYEEVDHQPSPNAAKALNFGWDLCEGRHLYPDTGTCNAAGTVLPQVEYTHASEGSDNCAVTGGYVYHGADYPTMQNLYFFGDYCSGRLWAIPTTFDAGNGDHLPVAMDTGVNIASFGLDARGELYLASLGGTVYQLIVD